MEKNKKSKSGRGALLVANLPALQSLIKRDPAGYREEFLQQWNHYESQRRIFELKPDHGLDTFAELVGFLAQVAPCYPAETAALPGQLSTLLLEHHATLSPDTRKTLVQSLVLLRNRDVIPSVELLKVLFPLLPITTSSTLRSYIRSTILSDIRNANQRSKNHKLNRVVQGLLFGMVERGMDAEMQGSKTKNKAAASAAGKAGAEAMWAVMLTKELWRKGVWNDAKTVSIVALACFHPTAKVQNAAIHFFLGSEDAVEDSDEEIEVPDVKKLQHQRTINKTRRSQEKKLAKQKKDASKKRKAKAAGTTPNFPALQLLHDPQGFAEKLYANLVKYDKQHSLDHKVLIMQLLSRVMGSHKLCVLSFYSYIVKYLTHHQLRVTLILVSLAQSVHDLTPPDILTPVIRKLASEFVHPGVGSEVVAAGINSIREICRRQPWCMEPELLEDLVEYRKSADKGVTTAARGLLQLYREVNPGMLKRRERGKVASMSTAAGKQPLQYGYSAEAPQGIEGIELLESHLEEKRAAAGSDTEDADEDDEGAWDGWEVESSDEDSDDEGGWIEVESDGEDLVFSDSDDEGAKNKDKKGKGKAKAKAEEVDDDADKEKDGEDADAPTAAESAVEKPGFSALATTKILTPADFALLNELRIKAATAEVEAGGGSSAKRKLAELNARKRTSAAGAEDDDAFLSESEILGPRKKTKADYAERMASVEKGREGREKFGSRKGKEKKEEYSSSTNRQKARNKPLMMAIHSTKIRSKKSASLRDKQKALQAHKVRQKKQGH